MRIRKIRIALVIALILLLSVNISTVFADPPEDLEIVAIETVGIGSVDPFTASGQAVDDSGKVCAAGDVEDLTVVIVNADSPIRILFVTKRFYCDEPSGTFDVSMTVQLNLSTNYTKAHWKIIGGTDNYVNLKGGGSLVGVPIVPGISITDTYTGKVH